MAKEKTWFQKLGYKQNPFIIKPYAFNEDLQGYRVQIRKVNTSIKRGRVIFIEGDYGVGKTAVLKEIIKAFKGKKKLIYYSANRSEGSIPFDALIKGRAGPLGKMFGVRPKELILMIDEAQKLTLHDCEKIEYLIKKGHFRSVILVSDSYAKANLTDSLRRKIGNKVLSLGEVISDYTAVKIVRTRLGKKNRKFMQPKIIKEVFERANRNPRTLLEHLEDIARYVVEEKGAEKVTPEDVAYVLA
ncbi:hypothetical protein GOV08_05365 [Candidatus Woesearchaeota archaeon]|nr:hypothetical protein [Candidatus Woesearchaeota archaeon]